MEVWLARHRPIAMMQWTQLIPWVFFKWDSVEEQKCIFEISNTRGGILKAQSEADGGTAIAIICPVVRFS